MHRLVLCHGPRFSEVHAAARAHFGDDLDLYVLASATDREFDPTRLPNPKKDKVILVHPNGQTNLDGLLDRGDICVATGGTLSQIWAIVLLSGGARLCRVVNELSEGHALDMMPACPCGKT